MVFKTCVRFGEVGKGVASQQQTATQFWGIWRKSCLCIWWEKNNTLTRGNHWLRIRVRPRRVERSPVSRSRCHYYLENLFLCTTGTPRLGCVLTNAISLIMMSINRRLLVLISNRVSGSAEGVLAYKCLVLWIELYHTEALKLFPVICCYG